MKLEISQSGSETALRENGAETELEQMVENAPSPSLKRRCRKLIEEICSTGTYLKLEVYAERRLHYLRVHSITGRDLMNEAIRSVLIGVGNSDMGRHPRVDDLKNVESFEVYLANVIKSLSSGAKRRDCRWQRLQPAGIEGSEYDCSELPKLIATENQPDQAADFRDFHEQFFMRLRERTSGHLRKLAKRWQRESQWSNTIPLRGYHRQYRADLRRVAQQVLAELEAHCSSST